MDMKRLEISRLMDEYTDTEFFPTGGSVANPETVKGWVLANVKAPAKKRQKPAKKKLFFAAALAAALVVLVGAGFPYIEHQLANGALIFKQAADGGRITGLVHYGSPVEAAEGRLFLNQKDGQRIDITDLISEEVPYLYDGSDPDTGLIYYLIVGGTPDNCSYLEWMTAPTPFDNSNNPTAGAHGSRMATVYAFECVTPDHSEKRSFGEGTGFDMPVQVYDWMDQPWLLTGLNELGIPFEYASETENGGSYVLE